MFLMPFTFPSFLPPALKDRKRFIMCDYTEDEEYKHESTHMKKVNAESRAYFLFGLPKHSRNNPLQYKYVHCLFLSKVNKNKITFRKSMLFLIF